MTSPLKVLLLDIETSPLIGYTWRKWDTSVVGDVVQEWYIMCASMKWEHEASYETIALPDYSRYKRSQKDDYSLLARLWWYLNEADVIVAHNGAKFDLRKINARLIQAGFPPPSPYKIVDTLKIARKYFAFTSNRLDDLGEYLGLGRKLEHQGFELWVRCMNGDRAAWKTMKAYCENDVVLLEKVYNVFKPWNVTQPNITVNDSLIDACPACGSATVKRGWGYTGSYRVRRYRCKNATCRKWSKGEREKLEGKLLA